jgi:hydrogenase nickel incorporation protein HypB
MKVEVFMDILKANDELARENRQLFAEKGLTVLNIISSPGAGKTTLLEETIKRVGTDISIGVIEGDVQTARDAERIGKLGVPVTQLNTQGACHLDSAMITEALKALPLDNIRLLFIENVGNLVCPASFELGEDGKVVILSVPEGSDKVAKYPAIFEKAEVCILNKIDLLEHTDFNREKFSQDMNKINPKITVFEMSASTGEGMEQWIHWLERKTKKSPK